MDYNKNYNETKKLQIGITCSYLHQFIFSYYL